ncbi:MAG TPA: hypothetical protein VMU84_21900 [Thermoanaerobaculia bacterium]|nr:hypothetical protein [Thermoanaerobaculia bacterium]
MSNETVDRFKLEQAKKSGAGWFMWVAALSLINTAIAMSGSNINFILGLGLTQVIDALFAQAAPTIKVIGFVFDLMFAGVFVLIWYLCKRYTWPFLTGIVIYALDTLIFLFAKEWIGLAFHGFALISMYGGFRSAQALSEMPPVVVAPPAPTPAEP